MSVPSIPVRIAAELGVKPWQVEATVGLLDEGATVPFIARYRKEATGLLDDAQLRTLDERLRYLRELDSRRDAVLAEIAAQGKLTAELERALASAATKAEIEDLYLPFRPKRTSKAQTAREAGLEPLAKALLADPGLDPSVFAARYVSPERGVADEASALAGARAILVEAFGEDPALSKELKQEFWASAKLVSAVREGKSVEGAKFSDYFDFAEPVTKIPSHRALALFRGEKEGILDLRFDTGEPAGARTVFEARIAARFGIADAGRPADRWLADAVRWAWRTSLSVRISVDTRMRLFERAEDEAVAVFSANLRDLLLAAPAGRRPTMGLDPGYRTGVKVAVVDGTGKVVATETVYPHEPANRWEDALAVLGGLARRHSVELVAVGNGTASRETDRLAAELARRNPALRLVKALVSEAGASVYSASAYASRELPSLDVSLRGAVSIARRLQDPLAELVKIDPKAIGVGQYQHDVSEHKLSRGLDAVVEDCVNAVGVDVNTASPPLLRRVSGLGESLADAIVSWRDANGAFRTREQLKEVRGLGPKAFEQCAGFLRIMDGDDPLDASCVHPESYPVARRIAAAASAGDVKALIGNGAALRKLSAAAFADGRFGAPTVADILRELEKPGRDPRPTFATASFKEGVEKLSDLRPGMLLEGVVTNVAAFGAFVDVGVHQDGLVHVSALSKDFVRDPRDVVRPGQVVRVKVIAVDPERKRISLSMRLDDKPEEARPRAGAGKPEPRRETRPAGPGAFADAFRKAGERKPGR